MASAGSVSFWIGQLQGGDSRAAQQLWERYFRQLVGLARQKLQGRPCGAADEEDVALSAFKSFCRGAKQGQFPQLHDREDLRQLLIAITSHKAISLMRREGRRKRGGGAVLDEAALADLICSGREEAAFEQLIGHEPSPESALEMAEEVTRLLDQLEDATLQSLALGKMEGYTNRELAVHLGFSPRTVERKLGLIRQIWAKEVAP
jgi:DNA-directed RNA polymerase specialized sigma24 family protein